MRVLQMGMGLTGCVVENFLIQEHNKASYSDGKLFEALMKEADKVAKRHLATVVRPAFGEAKGLVPQATAPTQPSASASASSAAMRSAASLASLPSASISSWYRAAASCTSASVTGRSSSCCSPEQ